MESVVISILKIWCPDPGRSPRMMKNWWKFNIKNCWTFWHRNWTCSAVFQQGMDSWSGWSSQHPDQHEPRVWQCLEVSGPCLAENEVKFRCIIRGTTHQPFQIVYCCSLNWRWFVLCLSCWYFHCGTLNFYINWLLKFVKLNFEIELSMCHCVNSYHIFFNQNELNKCWIALCISLNFELWYSLHHIEVELTRFWNWTDMSIFITWT